VAPDAEIVDVRVYDSGTPGEGEVGPTSAALAQGLRWVAHHARSLRIGVANISLNVTGSRELRAAVAMAQRAGVVVVAASGNRPGEGQLLADRFAEYHHGEDAARWVHPAGYDGVVAVSATADGAPGDEDATGFVLQNSATDVAAPTVGGVSVAANGSTCVLDDVATSWAAAEVSGVVALLRAAFPDDTAAQTVARLESTADGSPEARTVLEGAGVVQPVEALTRPLHPSRSGRIADDRVEDRPTRATAPEPEADVLADTRHAAVWWGLLGGGALLVALLLRPVLARRRS
jgi:membrane-anchored mycosin MYCP